LFYFRNKPITEIDGTRETYAIYTAVIIIIVIIIIITRKSCTRQVLPSAKYRPTRLVVDAAFRRIGKSRHGGHKVANISLNCQRI